MRPSGKRIQVSVAGINFCFPFVQPCLLPSYQGNEKRTGLGLFVSGVPGHCLANGPCFIRRHFGWLSLGAFFFPFPGPVISVFCSGISPLSSAGFMIFEGSGLSRGKFASGVPRLSLFKGVPALFFPVLWFSAWLSWASDLRGFRSPPLSL